MAEMTKRRLLRTEERQAQILRAASRAFMRGGFAAVSMDDVASEAGITRLIVYRHFASKEALYRAVLTAVADRLRDEFLVGTSVASRHDPGWIHRMMLGVARENPDGFRLLMVHASREPQFSVHHDDWEAKARSVADTMIGDRIDDPTLKAWAVRTIVASLVESVLAWLDCGEVSRDEEFVERASAALRAMYLAWSGTGLSAAGLPRRSLL
jgi:AcrR family transcriptional regulator